MWCHLIGVLLNIDHPVSELHLSFHSAPLAQCEVVLQQLKHTGQCSQNTRKGGRGPASLFRFSEKRIEKVIQASLFILSADDLNGH